jgi:hypothetical protein
VKYKLECPWAWINGDVLMMVPLKVAMTFNIMSGRNCRFEVSITNLFGDQSFPNGNITSKKERQWKSISDDKAKLASLHLWKLL